MKDSKQNCLRRLHKLLSYFLKLKERAKWAVSLCSVLKMEIIQFTQVSLQVPRLTWHSPPSYEFPSVPALCRALCPQSPHPASDHIAACFSPLRRTFLMLIHSVSQLCKLIWCLPALMQSLQESRFSLQGSSLSAYHCPEWLSGRKIIFLIHLAKLWWKAFFKLSFRMQ